MTIMFGWNAKTPQGETFGQIYHEQYRQQKGTTASKISGASVPLIILLGLFGHHLGPVFTFSMLGLGLVLLIATVLLTRRQRAATRSSVVP